MVWDGQFIIPVLRHETVYECCPEPFVDITYVIKFHKKGGWILG